MNDVHFPIGGQAARPFENTPVCQSCGMPMRSPDQHGKHADGSDHASYCIHCCPHGEEQMTGTLEEMIDFCAPLEVKLGLHPDEATARARLQAYLPTLARWKKKA